MLVDFSAFRLISVQSWPNLYHCINNYRHTARLCARNLCPNNGKSRIRICLELRMIRFVVVDFSLRCPFLNEFGHKLHFRMKCETFVLSNQLREVAKLVVVKVENDQ